LAVAAASTATSTPFPELSAIAAAATALRTLLDNWPRAIVDCTYADVPRELLESKNKAELLEKAKTSALFDKSAAVVSCKTTNRVVREFIGSTGKGPVASLDKALRRGLDRLGNGGSGDGDDDGALEEEYVQVMEEVQSAISKADSMSYAAGVSDLSSINNFEPGDESNVLESDGNLRETKLAIEAAVAGLDRIVELLKQGQ
jgi:hypothetical protein